MARLSAKGVSLAQARQLLQTIVRRERKAMRLQKMRAQLVAKLDRVNRRIEAFGEASPVVRKARKAGRKAAKAISRHARQAVGTLKDVAAKVLARTEGMNLTDLGHRVLKAGYQTKSNSRVFLTALQGILSKNRETFARLKRGVYALKSGKTAARAVRTRRARRVVSRKSSSTRPAGLVRSRSAAPVAEKVMEAGA